MTGLEAELEGLVLAPDLVDLRGGGWGFLAFLMASARDLVDSELDFVGESESVLKKEV